MDISSVFQINQPADKVFSLLLDLDRVAPCIPGATVGPEAADSSRPARIEVRFGPMGFTYEGKVRIAEADPDARRAVLTADVLERAGEGNAAATIAMKAEPIGATATRVAVETDLSITGGAAAMGTGMIEAAAEEMLEEFVAGLEWLLGGGAKPAAAGDGSAGVRPSQPSNAAAGAPAASSSRRALGGFGFMLRTLRRRLGRKLRGRAHGGPAGRNGVSVRVGRPNGSTSEPTLDLLIAGSGSGALAAAIVAHDAGLRVAIYEKSEFIGGGTAFSGGVVWAPDSHLMRRKGIDDSPERALEYLRNISGGRGDEEMQRTYIENISPIIQQVEEWTGIAWVIWPGQPDYYPDVAGAAVNGRAILQHPNSASKVLLPAEQAMPELELVRPTPHMDFVPGFQRSDRPARFSWLAGRSIIGGLWKAVVERGIEYHLSTPVVDLMHDGDTVIGAKVQPEGSPPKDLYARAVLLNTGGFDWNETFAHRYLPGPFAHPQTPPSNTGDGHVMAMKMGAGTALMDKAVWHPAIQIPGDLHEEGQPLYRMFNNELSKPHTLVVNKEGRRFANEAAYYDITDAWAHADMLTQTYPNVPSFFICDSRCRESYGLPGVRDDEEVPDWISVAETPAELAEALGIDKAGFLAQLKRFNEDAKAGVDGQFNRGTTAYERYWGDAEHAGPNPNMDTVSKAPFYGFEIHPSHAGARGGVTTSPTGQVLRADGRPIDGLYASGNTAANVLFGGGYGSGSAVGSSLVFGYLAAKSLVAQRAAAGSDATTAATR